MIKTIGRCASPVLGTREKSSLWGLLASQSTQPVHSRPNENSHLKSGEWLRKVPVIKDVYLWPPHANIHTHAYIHAYTHTHTDTIKYFGSKSDIPIEL